MPRSRLTQSAAFVALATASTAHAATVIYVDRSAPGVGDGRSWNTAFRSLQTALNTINGQLTPHDLEIRIAQGTYRPDVLSLTKTGFSISPGTTASAQHLTIKGGYAGRSSQTPELRDFVATPTVLSGDVLGNDTADEATRADNASTVVLLISSGSLDSTSLDGLTIRDGWQPDTHTTSWYDINGTGGGIQVYLAATQGNVTLRHCTVTHNRADGAGGGVGIAASILAGTHQYIALESCTISDNITGIYGKGGGLYASWRGVFPPPPIELIDCDVVENSVANSSGGGLALTDWNISVTRSRIHGNSARSRGGFDAFGASVTLVDSLVADNISAPGYVGGGNAVAIQCVNSTIAHNAASNGYELSATDIELTNCIIGDRNSAPSIRSMSVQSQLTVTNSMISLDYQPDGHLYGGGTLSPDSTGVLVPNPQFIDPDGPDNDPATWADNDYRLSPRSPAVDAGVLVATLPLLDAAAQPRLVSGIVGRPATLDLGCYESQLTLCPADLDADQAITIDDLLDFLHAFELGDALADLTTNGLTPRPDGAVTVEDLLFFLARFEGGC